MGMTEENGQLVHVSMGQGQERVAEKALPDCLERGSWLMLHNIHLMRKWVATLEATVRSYSLIGTPMADTSLRCNPSFRLFLSAEPAEHLPGGLLQRAVKLVCEAPTGLKSNFLRAYQLYPSEPWEHSTKPQEYHSIVYTLCYLHSVMVERRRFGPAGWNRSYPFNIEDPRSLCGRADELH